MNPADETIDIFKATVIYLIICDYQFIDFPSCTRTDMIILTSNAWFADLQLLMHFVVNVSMSSQGSEEFRILLHNTC